MSATNGRTNLRDLPVALKGKILPGTLETVARVAPLLEILMATECHPQPTAATATTTTTTTSTTPPEIGLSATESNGYRCRPYLDLSETENASVTVEAQRLVRRDCYDHMLPLILDRMKTDKRVALGGTPGIGKTVFGFFVLRELMMNVSACHTSVYWDKNHATMFSTDAHNTSKYGLNMQAEIGGVQWSYGTWEPDERSLKIEVLIPDDIYVIHDPQEKFLDAGTERRATRLLIILSFGHALVSEWNTKGGRPRLAATMPRFREREIAANKSNLFFQKTNISGDARVKQLYSRFGGTIRHWGMYTESGAWEEMLAKVEEAARNNGANIIVRATNHRGSIVHIDVDFDITKKLYPEPGHNDFDGGYYLLGSTEIANDFANRLKSLGGDQIKAFMASVRNERGGEALYGLLFEVHAHHYLRHVKGDVNIRIVRHDGKNKNQYATIGVPVGPGILNFPGAEAKGISEAAGDTKRAVGTYILPDLGSFPTYDAAVVIPGEIVGFAEKKFVGLLLQMTVSGATSLRRSPEHVVRQYMRKKMHTALEAAIEGFSSNCISQ